MNSADRQHPCLAFYRGDSRLELRLPAEGSDAEGTTKTMGIILLHHTLFPPAAIGQLGEVADENYAAQVASPLGLEPLRLNWRTLLRVLFPCMLHGDPLGVSGASPQVSADAAEEGEREKQSLTGPPPAHDAPPPVITAASSAICVTTHVTVDDYNGLREPGMMDRLYYSFVVYLRFFGWRVHDEQRGVLDRHRNWRQRYELLEKGYTDSSFASAFLNDIVKASAKDDATPQKIAQVVKTKTRETLLAMPAEPPQVDSVDCYTIALLRIVHCFLDFGFLTLAVGLVAFLLDEMASGRLLFLHDYVESAMLPCITACEDIDAGHKKRLNKKLFRLTHSDSD